MAERDLYAILGVAKDATADQIRKAYRDLARKLHPDVNKAPDAQQKFTQVQEAYEVLSDDAKRRQYDRYGRAGVGSVGGGAPGRSYAWSSTGGDARSGGMEFDLEDLGSMFDAFFKGAGEGGPSRGFGGSPGGFGSRSGPGRARTASPRRGADITSELQVPFLTAARGGKQRFQIANDGDRSTIDVTIPAGIPDATKLRLKGRGEPGGRGAEPGDLHLIIRVQDHPLFWREEQSPLDLFLELPLTIAEATLGATVSVPTLSDHVSLKIPPGTPSGRKLRLRGRGIVATKKGESATGDLYAVVRIVPPFGEDLSEDETRTLRDIADRFPRPRVGPEWETN